MTPTGLVAGQPDPVLLWHWRLNHPSVEKLLLLFLMSPLFFLSCESYELGKHHRATFHSRDSNRTSSTFELVHSDVWGPSRGNL